jgi:acyl dehydratase
MDDTETREPAEGDTYTHERTFTTEEVRLFAEVTGDDQPIHTEPDDRGRLVVQGLLTATLPTKIGGDLQVLASGMEFSFRRRVYTGQRVACEWTNTALEPVEGRERDRIEAEVVCRAEGEVVLTAEIAGLV